MNCIKCSAVIEGRGEKFCSKRCTKNYHESLRRKRLRAKYNEYNRNYRKLGHRHLTTDDRKKMVESLGEACERCGTTSNLDIHHIRPLRLGGKNSVRNLILFCEGCHNDWHRSFDMKFWQHVS